LAELGDGEVFVSGTGAIAAKSRFRPLKKYFFGKVTLWLTQGVTL